MGNSFQYEIPGRLRGEVHPGSLVWASFGRRKSVGCVVSVSGEKKVSELKEIIGLATPEFGISEELLTLGQWVSEYYMAPIGEALAAVSFIGFRSLKEKSRRCVRLTGEAEGRITEAVKAYRAAIRADPSFARAYTALADVLAMQGRIEEAIREYRRALRIKPDDPSIERRLEQALTGKTGSVRD